MEVSTIIVFVSSFLIALSASWLLLIPFFLEGGEPKVKLDLDASESIAKKELLFEALEEVEQDHLSGKIDQNEYSQAKEELVVQIADCLKKVDGNVSTSS